MCYPKAIFFIFFNNFSLLLCTIYYLLFLDCFNFFKTYCILISIFLILFFFLLFLWRKKKNLIQTATFSLPSLFFNFCHLLFLILFFLRSFLPLCYFSLLAFSFLFLLSSYILEFILLFINLATSSFELFPLTILFILKIKLFSFFLTFFFVFIFYQLFNFVDLLSSFLFLFVFFNIAL